MFNKILVAFDGSDHAKWALDKAIQIAKQNDSAEIIVYYAIRHHFRPMRMLPFPFLSPTNDDPLALDPAAEQQVYQSHKELAERVLKEAGKKLKDGQVKGRLELVENSSPVDAAEELVEKEGIDLVIVGARGVHNAVERVLLGSVSSGIVNHVCSNILVMRSECGI